jgi:hypothetical protein
MPGLVPAGCFDELHACTIAAPDATDNSKEVVFRFAMVPIPYLTHPLRIEIYAQGARRTGGQRAR